MQFFGFHPRSNLFGLAASLALVALIPIGCGRKDVQVYEVAKDPSAPQGAKQKMPQGHPDSTAGMMPALSWKLPAGWEEVPPGQMRAASFRIKGSDNKVADVSAIPLPGRAGSDLDNVNRWRAQVGLEPIPEAELAKIAEQVAVGSDKGQLYDLSGTNPGSGDPTRILAAIVRRDGIAWFFKVIGDDKLVASQKTPFQEFLKSVDFTKPSPSQMAAAQQSMDPSKPMELPASHPPIGGATQPLPDSHPPIGGGGAMPLASAAPAAPAASRADQPKWSVPSGWKAVNGGQFLVAKFMLPGADAGVGSVNISTSAGDGGGLVGNVNRWRGQLGLGQLSEDEVKKLAKEISVKSGKAWLVEMGGTDARSGNKALLVAAVVPVAGKTWFYKMMGNEDVVAREKEAFSKLVESAEY